MPTGIIIKIRQADRMQGQLKYTHEEIGTIWRGHKTLVMLNILLAMLLNENDLLEKVIFEKKEEKCKFPRISLAINTQRVYQANYHMERKC